MNRGSLVPGSSSIFDMPDSVASTPTATGSHVGATCSYADLLASDLVGRALPLLSLMAAGVTGGRQIQGQGTIGGSVVAARPQSDVPAASWRSAARPSSRARDGERAVR